MSEKNPFDDPDLGSLEDAYRRWLIRRPSECDRLREALEFYANPLLWQPDAMNGPVALEDNGARARCALSRKPPPPS